MTPHPDTTSASGASAEERAAIDPTRPVWMKDGTPIRNLVWHTYKGESFWIGIAPNGNPWRWYRRDGVRDNDRFSLTNEKPAAACKTAPRPDLDGIETRAKRAICNSWRWGEAPDPITVQIWVDHTRALEAENGQRAERIARLRELVQYLIDNNPDEPIDDAGHVVLDLWRHDAKQALGTDR